MLLFESRKRLKVRNNENYICHECRRNKRQLLSPFKVYYSFQDAKKCIKSK